MCWIWCINQFIIHKAVISDWSFSGIDNLHLTRGALTLERLAVSDSATNAHLLASRRSRIPIYNGRIDSCRGTSNSVNEMCCVWLSSQYLIDRQTDRQVLIPFLTNCFFTPSYWINLFEYGWITTICRVMARNGKRRFWGNGHCLR